MILKLVGHDYKYAAEQIMLMMFPGERPEYAEPVLGTASAVITVTRRADHVTASTRLQTAEGAVFRGMSRVSSDKLCGKLETDRLLQKIIKLSFFRAAVRATGQNPAWGALTGIRPGKLVTAMLERGFSYRRATGALVREYSVSPERAALCADTARASLEVKRSLLPLDVCLYIGIPFCPTRCAYCSFVSHSVEKASKLVEPFLLTLSREIDETAALAGSLGLRVISVYMGGGTPTTLSAEQLDGLLGHLEKRFDLSSVREFTVEAGRPDTITPAKLAVLRSHGVGRISVNPQTMSDRVLEAIGRRHSAEDVLKAADLVRGAGFDGMNMDLIAGLPADSPSGFSDTLDKVLSLAPENITVHTLSLKRGTRITLESTEIPSGAEVADMLDAAESRLRGAGYVPYYLYRQKFMSGGFENVGWCLPGHEGLYNICIMEELCTILALGGGGVTKLVAPGSGRIERIFNAKYPYEYIASEEKMSERKDKIREFYEKEFF